MRASIQETTLQKHKIFLSPHPIKKRSNQSLQCISRRTFSPPSILHKCFFVDITFFISFFPVLPFCTCSKHAHESQFKASIDIKPPKQKKGGKEACSSFIFSIMVVRIPSRINFNSHMEHHRIARFMSVHNAILCGG